MLTGLGRGPEPAPLPVTASAVLRVPQAAAGFVCNQKLYTKKSRGRPTGTKYSETIPARLEPAIVASLDAWAASHGVSRSEAIRRLVELGLKSKGK
jgi:hypothetical protein